MPADFLLVIRLAAMHRINHSGFFEPLSSGSALHWP